MFYAGNDFCYTLHIMDSTGASVIVNKKCANSSECWESGVGCLKVDSQTVCLLFFITTVIIQKLQVIITTF